MSPSGRGTTLASVVEAAVRASGPAVNWLARLAGMTMGRTLTKHVQKSEPERRGPSAEMETRLHRMCFENQDVGGQQ